MSNKVRINPKDPTYEGCYQHTTTKGLVVYWIKKNINGKTWHKVGYAHDGITPKYVKQFRGALTTENINKVLPTNHRRQPKEEDRVPTVDEAWKEHYVPWAKRSLKPNTYWGKFNRYQKHIKPYIGKTRLDKLTVA